MSEPQQMPAGLRGQVRSLVDSTWFQRTIIVLIVANAVILGLETYPAVMEAAGPLLQGVNTVLILIFAIEILLRMLAYGLAFWRNGWNIFDFIVVAVAFIPAGSTSSVLRLLRLLRVLRLLSTVRSMRVVVAALGAAVPGMLSVGALLVMIIYVFAVASTTVLGPISPVFFGDLWVSVASMFRVAIGDGWEDVITPIALEHPWVWAYFMVYGIVSSVVILNLFIAVAVEGMDRMKALGLAEDIEEDIRLDTTTLGELAALREQLARMEAKLDARDAG